MEILDTIHPIIAGVPNFSVPDELHVLDCAPTGLSVLAVARLGEDTQPRGTSAPERPAASSTWASATTPGASAPSPSACWPGRGLHGPPADEGWLVLLP